MAYPVSGALAPWFGSQAPTNRLLAMLVVYLIVSLSVYLLARALKEYIAQFKLQAYDHHLGLLLGAMKGVLAATVVTFFLVTLSTTARESIANTRSGYAAAVVMDQLHDIMPPEIHDRFHPFIHSLDHVYTDRHDAHEHDGEHRHDEEGEPHDAHERVIPETSSRPEEDASEASSREELEAILEDDLDAILDVVRRSVLDCDHHEMSSGRSTMRCSVTNLGEFARRRVPGFPLIAGFLACGLLATAFLFGSGCSTAPVTGRRQLLIVPESQEIAMGVAAYEELLSSEPPSQDERAIALVNRVGKRIAQVANRPDYEWEFRLIAKDSQNAFALPGGKVAVYEGILPVCANEAGLAVVLSHEIAHALARHGGERTSQTAIAKGLEVVLDRTVRDQQAYNQRLIMGAYGAASQYGVLLPFSRKHELEADSIGLALMARAGYDPREAPRFWDRFAALKQGSQTLEFLSTHPDDERRRDQLLQQLEQVLGDYRAGPVRYGIGDEI